MSRGVVLFVDDEPENVALAAEILGEALAARLVGADAVRVVDTVEKAVRILQDVPVVLVIMDLFIPLGDHPDRVLGARARRYQDQVEHLGGLVLLEEIDRVTPRPLVVSHTACTDPVLLELFGDRVARRLPKPAPLDTLLANLLDLLESLPAARRPG